MAKRTRIVQRERPLVLLSGMHSDEIRPMLDLALEWDWELRGTWTPDNAWQERVTFAGAIIKDLAGSPNAERLRRNGCPAVRFGARPNPGDKLLPSVLQDLSAGGRMAAEHFAVRNFRQVAYVGFNPADPDANTHAAYIAFRDHAAELGMGCQLFSLHDSDRKGEADRQYARHRDLMAWLKGLPKPVGVFCFNDIMAEQALMICAQAGLSVPEDVALLGYGNSVQCEVAPIRLSSVDPGLEERVRVAMRLLRSLMGGKSRPREPVMVPPAGIIERRSTNVLAVGDPVVARALRFMWDNFERDLSVPDVAGEVGVNRRMLERSFRVELGRTVREELRRRRLDTACGLLRSSNDSIADIAAKVGYRSSQYLHRAFLAKYGKTPRAYRIDGR